MTAIALKPVTLSSPTEVIYLEYDPNAIPPPPSGGWTRFVCVSDTHSRTFEVPAGDVLLHSGDLTNTGTVLQFRKTVNWLSDLPHKVKIIIAGNHDLTLHESWYENNFYRWHRNGKESVKSIREMLRGAKAKAAGLVYLQDESYSFQAKPGGRRWTVYGSPWSPEFFNWAFNYERDEAEALVSRIPKVDLLLTHGPPFNALDATLHGEHVGCRALAARLSSLRPRIHLFGHIHEAHGARVIDWDSQPMDVPWNAPGQPAADAAEEYVTLEDDDDSSPMAVDNGGNTLTSNNPTAVDDTLPPSESHPPSSSDTASVEKVAPVLGRTVIVNGANWPLGPRARRDGRGVPFGGPGFQPVIVDLKD